VSFTKESITIGRESLPEVGSSLREIAEVFKKFRKPEPKRNWKRILDYGQVVLK
jgi:hypothetical protein